MGHILFSMLFAILTWEAYRISLYRAIESKDIEIFSLECANEICKLTLAADKI